MKKIIFLFILQLVLIITYGQTFKVGDKVEIFNSGGLYKGSILEIGTGGNSGYYSVHYDQYAQPQWMKASNIKLQKAATINNDPGTGPRNGQYIILSYGSPANPIRIGYFDLKNGQYTYYNMSKAVLGQGTYNFDAANKMVIWKTGPFKNSKWGGGFEIDREGKTHKIRLNSVTIGSNSTDSD
ncbi:MAG: hypothetical protein ABJA78_13420 [Ferruginibacter sp.]